MPRPFNLSLKMHPSENQLNAPILKKVSGSYFKLIDSRVIRIGSYCFYQLSVPISLGHAINQFYKYETNNNKDTTAQIVVYFAIPAAIFFAGFGGFVATRIQKHLAQLESGEMNSKPNFLIRITPGVFAAELGFLTGLQAYAFTGTNFIDNLLVNRILMTLSGIVSAGLSAKFTPNIKSWESFTLSRLKPGIPKDLLEVFSLHRKLFKYSALIIPPIRALGAISLVRIILIATPENPRPDDDFGLYANISGFGLGLLNLLYYLKSDQYLGENTKNFMSYLTHSAYSLLGMAMITYLLLYLCGNTDDAERPDLGGALYVILPLALLLAGSIPYDQHRMQLNARKEVLREYALKVEGQEMEQLESGASNSDTSTDESDTSLGSIPAESNPEDPLNDALIQSSLSDDVPVESKPKSGKSGQYSPRFLNDKKRSTVIIEEVPVETPTGVQTILCVSDNRHAFLGKASSSKKGMNNDTLRQPLLDNWSGQPS